ncbi:hypothetical protein ACVW2L_003600 [Mucilaginibacter sp. HD30]
MPIFRAAYVRHFSQPGDERVFRTIIQWQQKISIKRKVSISGVSNLHMLLRIPTKTLN